MYGSYLLICLWLLLMELIKLFVLYCRPLTRTLGITVPWHTVWSSHRHRRVRTALSSRPTQVSSNQPSCFETCAGPTSSLKLLPQMTMEKVSAAGLKWWWVCSIMPFIVYMYVCGNINKILYILCMYCIYGDHSLSVLTSTQQCHIDCTLCLWLPLPGICAVNSV